MPKAPRQGAAAIRTSSLAFPFFSLSVQSMAAPRFYCPEADFVVGRKTVLPEEARHHAGRVLRMRAGDIARLFDGRGNECSGPIFFEGPEAWVDVEEISQPEVESPAQITLVQALVSPEKMDWIVEKAVETGVSRIVVVPALRSMTRLSGERLQKRLAHFKSVVISACAQSGRTRVPEVAFMPFEEALELSADARILLAPAARAAAALSGARSFLLAVGPEGGFDATEIEAARKAGWQCALLGPRVLRTETAGIVAAAVINAVAGDYRFS